MKDTNKLEENSLEVFDSRVFKMNNKIQNWNYIKNLISKIENNIFNIRLREREKNKVRKWERKKKESNVEGRKKSRWKMKGTRKEGNVSICTTRNVVYLCLCFSSL